MPVTWQLSPEQASPHACYTLTVPISTQRHFPRAWWILYVFCIVVPANLGSIFQLFNINFLNHLKAKFSAQVVIYQMASTSEGQSQPLFHHQAQEN